MKNLKINDKKVTSNKTESEKKLNDLLVKHKLLSTEGFHILR